MYTTLAINSVSERQLNSVAEVVKQSGKSDETPEEEKKEEEDQPSKKETEISAQHKYKWTQQDIRTIQAFFLKAFKGANITGE
jgi:predicted Mrr-cat superfamily restriction endonuclease